MGIIRKMFGKYLLITNTVSCGLMMGGGDLIQQKTELFKKSICENKNNIKDTYNLADDPFDIIRTRNMTTVGIIQGPFNHYFYTLLDRFLPGKNTFSIMKKTILDQTIASPTCLGIFFIGLGYLEKKNFKEITNEISHKIFDIWKIDCMFWPPTQWINFLLVPVRYRVLYCNTMMMFYDMILSYMKYDV